jgi:serine/threonine protein kinase
MGIVTLSLFTGDTHIKSKELHDLGQSIITTRITNALQHPCIQISTRARDFIERLLVFNPKERMLASEAVEHEWFRRPDSPGVAAKLDELYERANKYWWKRTSSIDLIEHLPDVTIAKGKRVDTYNRTRQNRPKIQKKIPDATASQYFGLDRHLQHPKAVSASILNSKRRMLLAKLIETDSQFIDPRKRASERGTSIEKARTIALFPMKPPPVNIIRRKPSITKTIAEDSSPRRLASIFSSQSQLTTESIKEVDATDLFGTTPAEAKATQVAEDFSSSFSPPQPTPALRSSNDAVMEAQNMNSQSTSIKEHDDLTLQQLRAFAYRHMPSQVSDINDLSPPRLGMKGPKRSYTESMEDRNLHEEAAKALPKLTTAKAYSQAIATKKQSAQAKGG